MNLFTGLEEEDNDEETPLHVCSGAVRCIGSHNHHGDKILELNIAVETTAIPEDQL